MPKNRTCALLLALTMALPACGKRSVIVHNATDRTLSIRIVDDAFLSHQRTLEQAQLQPEDTQTFGPYQIPALDPMTVEIGLAGDRGNLPQTMRVDKHNVSLIVEPAGLDTWTGFKIRREDKRFK